MYNHNPRSILMQGCTHAALVEGDTKYQGAMVIRFYFKRCTIIFMSHIGKIFSMQYSLQAIMSKMPILMQAGALNVSHCQRHGDHYAFIRCKNGLV